ncbi:MAG: SDR family NAD(P)-dependent oxidoreductase, partial [Terriglobales bacterium]
MPDGAPRSSLASPPQPQLAAAVSGASSGIGRAAAIALLRAGWDVAALGRRRERLESLAAEAGAAPARVLPLTADLLEAPSVAAAAAAIRAWRPRLHALVTSAGDFFVRPMEATTASEFERMWRLTV